MSASATQGGHNKHTRCRLGHRSFIWYKNWYDGQQLVSYSQSHTKMKQPVYIEQSGPRLARLLAWPQCSVHNNNNNRLRPFVRDYLGEPVPGETPTHRPDHPIFITSSIYHDPQHPPCSNYVLGNLFAQPLSMSSGLPLGLEPSTSYSIHFFTQSVSSFRSTCPYHHNLFCVVLISYLFLVFLSTPYLELYLLP